MIRFERLKNMSIEEAAEFFAVDKYNNLPSTPCYICDYNEGMFCTNDGCTDEYKVWLYKEWLKEEFVDEPKNECVIDLSVENKGV